MKVYLAGPFWKKEERENIEKARDILRSRGFEVFVPMEHKIEDAWDLCNEVWGQKVFELDKDAIYDCDVVVAMYYGLYSDSGTAWEIGFANCLNKKIVIVHCEKTQESSIMVVNGSSFNLGEIDDLKTLDFDNLEKNNLFSHISQK